MAPFVGKFRQQDFLQVLSPDNAVARAALRAAYQARVAADQLRARKEQAAKEREEREEAEAKEERDPYGLQGYGAFSKGKMVMLWDWLLKKRPGLNTSNLPAKMDDGRPQSILLRLGAER